MYPQQAEKINGDAFMAFFELRPVEDRNATLDAGHPVYRDAEFVTIGIPGGKDQRVEEVNDRYIEMFPDLYKRFKAGLEQRPEGSSIKMWPLATPAMVRNLEALQIYTIEQLAVLPDAACDRVGPNGYNLRSQAQNWLKAADDKGKLAQQSAAQEVALASRDQEIADLKTQLGSLESQIKAMAAMSGQEKVPAAPPQAAPPPRQQRQK